MGKGSRQDFLKTINHEQPGRVVVDFGSTAVTGIHVLVVEKLRARYGLGKRPVKVVEPYQMLGEIDNELIEAMEVDVVGLYGENNMFGIPNRDWKVDRTPWGQEVMFPGDFNYKFNDRGDILIFPGGDTTVGPSAMMPRGGYFFDALDRQRPIDDATLRVEDNLEEFSLLTDSDIAYWKKAADSLDYKSRGVMASLGGTALGDIALVPAMHLKHPSGIRGVAEWYMSTLTRVDFIKKLYGRQTDIALANLEKISRAIGDRIDVVFICGTDFGTQNSTFCSPGVYREMWLPYYRKVNDWIHANTSWKTFKHSCGAVETFMELFIESGFDIINPVQVNAAGMDPATLKKKYGRQITFWGGGVDTQGVFPFGTPGQVKEQVKKHCEILNDGGGFVFNTIHNIQANVPFANVVAMLDALKEIR
jgi:hypothetical protein